MTLPDKSDNLWIYEGVNGLMIAADTIGDGHYTEYPSGKETVALQIPFAQGKLPEHTVIGNGTCEANVRYNDRETTRQLGPDEKQDLLS